MATARSAFLVLFVCALAFVAAAQSGDHNQPSAQRGTKVALVNLAKVFKQHVRFMEERERFDRTASEIEDGLIARQKEIRKQKEQLEKLKSGDDGYAEGQAEITLLEAKLKADASNEERRLKAEKAELYERTLDQIQRVIGTYAREHQIDLVLKYSSPSAGEDKTEAVTNRINQLVLYESGVDITAEIVAAVNADQATATK